jgi:hypothetical protein
MQHYSQLPSFGKIQDVLQLNNGLRKCSKPYSEVSGFHFVLFWIF